jgi:hypothetical protein
MHLITLFREHIIISDVQANEILTNVYKNQPSQSHIVI